MIAALLATTACQSDLFFGQVEGVSGKILAPNGRTPLYKALVTIQDKETGGYYGETYTSASGDFSFASIPDAEYRINVTSPNDFFGAVYFTEVEDGHSPGGVEILMQPARTGTFFDLDGRYDDAGAVLVDLGYLYRTIDVSALAASDNVLEGGDVALLASGVDVAWAEDAQVIANLKSFVEAGGRLIVSDRAWPFLAAAWPGKINWGADPEVGDADQYIEAAITDPDMKRCAGVGKWRVKYGAGAWALPEGTAGTVYVSGDVGTAAGPRVNAPLLIGFEAGAGYVAFSTFEWRTQYENGRIPVRVLNYLIANK